MTASRALEEMSWTDVRAALDAGVRAIIVPCGAMEQHGPHLPLLTDAALAVELARRVADQIDGVLRGPVVSIGISEHHMAFPGTVSLTPATFTAVLEEYLASLDRHDFPAAYVFSAHGGNFAALRELEHATGGRVGQLAVRCYSDLDGFFNAFYTAAADDGIAPPTCGVHAGEGETSEMMRLRPDLVRNERFAAGFTGDYDEEAQATLWRRGMAALTETGVLGDPTRASAERGERYLDALATVLAEDLRRRLPAA